MSIVDFLKNQEWDAPFFKILADFDSGASEAHMAGIYLPKSLKTYLPSLDLASLSPGSPTTDRYLRADMFIGTTLVASGDVRYQLQTWRGTRSGESRMTQIAPIRRESEAGDLIVFQRSIEALDLFRLILVKKMSDGFAELAGAVKNRKWGSLYEENEPLSQDRLEKATREMARITDEPFQITRRTVERIETRQSRIARRAAFRERVRLEYDKRCAITGIQICTPTNLYEIEAAHVVPVCESGVDDVRNGIALTQTLHWAFDRGLFGIDRNRRVFVPLSVRNLGGNEYLAELHGKGIIEARTETLRVHREALEWHLEHRVAKWTKPPRPRC